MHQHTLSTHPINTPYQPILSTHPINTSYQHKLSTHPPIPPLNSPLPSPSHHSATTEDVLWPIVLAGLHGAHIYLWAVNHHLFHSTAGDDTPSLPPPPPLPRPLSFPVVLYMICTLPSLSLTHTTPSPLLHCRLLSLDQVKDASYCV